MQKQADAIIFNNWITNLNNTGQLKDAAPRI